VAKQKSSHAVKPSKPPSKRRFAGVAAGVGYDEGALTEVDRGRFVGDKIVLQGIGVRVNGGEMR
jgi:hypothetical protein